MGTQGCYGLKNSKEVTARRKAKKAYWMAKGCTERKAESLVYRYGY